MSYYEGPGFPPPADAEKDKKARKDNKDKKPFVLPVAAVDTQPKVEQKPIGVTFQELLKKSKAVSEEPTKVETPLAAAAEEKPVSVPEPKVEKAQESIDEFAASEQPAEQQPVPPVEKDEAVVDEPAVDHEFFQRDAPPRSTNKFFEIPLAATAQPKPAPEVAPAPAASAPESVAAENPLPTLTSPETATPPFEQVVNRSAAEATGGDGGNQPPKGPETAPPSPEPEPQPNNPAPQFTEAMNNNRQAEIAAAMSTAGQTEQGNENQPTPSSLQWGGGRRGESLAERFRTNQRIRAVKRQNKRLQRAQQASEKRQGNVNQEQTGMLEKLTQRLENLQDRFKKHESQPIPGPSLETPPAPKPETLTMPPIGPERPPVAPVASPEKIGPPEILPPVVDQDQPIEVPKDHRVEMSSWHRVEIDNKTGQAVENPVVAYGEEFQREQQQEVRQDDSMAMPPPTINEPITNSDLGTTLSSLLAAQAKERSSNPATAQPQPQPQQPVKTTVSVNPKSIVKSDDIWLWVILGVIIIAIIVAIAA